MGGEIIVGRVKYYKTTFSSHAETESEQGVAEDRTETEKVSTWVIED